jgi:hypothetical protein
MAKEARGLIVADMLESYRHFFALTEPIPGQAMFSVHGERSINIC